MNKKGMNEMKKKKVHTAEQAKYDRGQIFVKVIAGILAIMMVVAVAASLIVSLMNMKQEKYMGIDFGTNLQNFFNENILTYFYKQVNKID